MTDKHPLFMPKWLLHLTPVNLPTLQSSGLTMGPGLRSAVTNLEYQRFKHQDMSYFNALLSFQKPDFFFTCFFPSNLSKEKSVFYLKAEGTQSIRDRNPEKSFIYCFTSSNASKARVRLGILELGLGLLSKLMLWSTWNACTLSFF